MMCCMIKPGFFDKYFPASGREVVKLFITNEELLPGLMKIKWFPETSIIPVISCCGYRSGGTCTICRVRAVC